MTDIPETMRAFVLHGHGDFDQLRLHHDWRVPSPTDDQVLIRVKACGLNNTDINTRTGWYSKTVTSGTTGGIYEGDQDDDGGWDGGIDFPRIQGGDAVGIVATVGENADLTLIGKRVLVDTITRDWDDPMNYAHTNYMGSAFDGGFADCMLADRRNVHPVETDFTDAELVDCLQQKSLFWGFPFGFFCATVLDAYRNIFHGFICRPQTAFTDHL